MILPDIVRASEARRAVTPRRVSGRSGRSDAPRTESAARVVNRRRVSALVDSPVASPAARSARELRFARSSRSRRLPDARVLGAHSRARARFRAVSRSSKSPRRRSGSHARRPSNDAGRGDAAIRGCPGIRRERPARIHADPRARDGPGPSPQAQARSPPRLEEQASLRETPRVRPRPRPRPRPLDRGSLGVASAHGGRTPADAHLRLHVSARQLLLRVSSTRGQGEPPVFPRERPEQAPPRREARVHGLHRGRQVPRGGPLPARGGGAHREAPREGRRRRRRRRKRPVHLHHRQGGRRVVARRLIRRRGGDRGAGRGGGRAGGVRRRRSSEGGRGEDEGATKRKD